MRIVVGIGVCALVACKFEPNAVTGDTSGDARAIDGPSAPWLPEFTYRRPLAIRNPTTAAFADFPVGIVVGADAALAEHATAPDLVVTSDDGTTLLDTELVTFGTGGELELWVRLPQLPPGTTTAFLYYGGTTTNRLPGSVWSGRHVGVWHLSESTDDAPASSTIATFALPPLPNNVPAHDVGIAGRARSFTNGPALKLGDAATMDVLDFGTGSFTYSLWVKETVAHSEYDTAFWKGGTSDNEVGYCMLLGTNLWGAKVHQGGSTGYVDARFGDEGDFVGKWTQLVGVVDRDANELRAYVNGAMTDKVSIAGFGTLSTNKPFEIGASDAAPFDGLIDEVRIYNVALPADWIAAEHANLTDPEFVKLGTEQTH